MIVSQFGVESWMDQYEEGAKYNITDTCAKPLSLAELFSLAGEDRADFMERFLQESRHTAPSSARRRSRRKSAVSMRASLRRKS